ncbi:MAG: DsbA family protein [Chloroflexota bacterium]
MRILLVMALMLALVSVIAAQDDEDEGDGEDVDITLDLYPEVPTVRGMDGAFVLGETDAPVTVIEFADYLCPACQTYHETMKDFIDEYVLTGQARLEYRFFPIIDQALSPLLSVVTECAFDQNAFWRVHNELYVMAEERAIDQDVITTLAERTGIDAGLMTECIEGEGPFQYQEDTIFGQQLNVTGTPAIRVRVGEGDAGLLEIEGQRFDSGGVNLSVLGDFVESDNPEALVYLPNQVLNEDLVEDPALVEVVEGCDVPCWRGITPGETDFDEALTVIENDEAFTNVQTAEQQGQRIAVWDTEAGEPCCQLISTDGTTVSYVQLLTAPNNTIGGLIETRGEPPYVDGSPITDSQAVFNLYYPDLNTIVFVFAPGVDAELTDDSQIVGVVYLAPDLMAEIVGSTPLHEWDGYQTLATYLDSDFELNAPE